MPLSYMEYVTLSFYSFWQIKSNFFTQHQQLSFIQMFFSPFTRYCASCMMWLFNLLMLWLHSYMWSKQNLSVNLTGVLICQIARVDVHEWERYNSPVTCNNIIREHSIVHCIGTLWYGVFIVYCRGNCQIKHSLITVFS